MDILVFESDKQMAKAAMAARAHQVANTNNYTQLICDFCSRTPVLWRYDIPDFTLTVIMSPGHITKHESTGGWAACGACKLMVDAADAAGLVAYSLTSLDTSSMDPAIVPLFKAHASLSLLNTHSQFFEQWQAVDCRPPTPV